MRSLSTARRFPLPFTAAALAAGLGLSCIVVPPPSSEPLSDEGYTPSGGPPAADTLDAPSEVGRLSLVEGAISFRPAAADTWAVAQLNRPVTTGDRIWADTASRAELEIGANAVRIGPHTELDITHLDDDMVQLAVPEGTIELTIRHFEVGGEYEFDAPNAAVNPQHEGAYRVDVSPDGDTSRITVRTGIAEVTAAGSTFEVGDGQMATVVGDTAPTYNLAAAGPSDAFDDWVSELDRDESRATTASQYLPPGVSGLDQLDQYGTWATDPVCGPVWYPRVAAGWAPYADGNWVWVGPWGWSWIESEPWGWAPFHYGRWDLIGDVWGWCPGAYPYGAIYAPALVAFIGGPGWAPGPWFPPGGGWGWFPLGWGDYYVPPYYAGPSYRHWINGRMPGPRTPYRNRDVPGAVVVAPVAAFERAEPIARVAVHLPPAALARAPIYGFAPGVAPTRASLAFGIGEGRIGPRPPTAVLERPVVALRPPPPRPVPFALERPLLSRLDGRPLPPSEVARIRAQLPPNERLTIRPFRPATVPLRPGAVLRPAHPGLAARPALVAPPARPVAVPRSPLDESYDAERRAMAQRHMAEFAQPPEHESQADLAARQEAERRELQARYNAARNAGMTRLPPPRVSHGGGGHGRR